MGNSDFHESNQNQEFQAEKQEIHDGVPSNNNTTSSKNNDNSNNVICDDSSTLRKSNGNEREGSKKTLFSGFNGSKNLPLSGRIKYAIKRWLLVIIFVTILVYFNNVVLHLNNNGSSSVPNCSSQENISLLKQTLSEHINWTQFIYGFNPNNGYKIEGIYIANEPDKVLHKSFCKALIKAKNNNGKINHIDVYYNLQYSTDGKNTEITVLNPFNR